MIMKLQRLVKNPEFTLGRLEVGKLTLYTCEDAVREIKGKPVSEWKIKAKTAIPVGTYRVIISFSNRFQKMLPLLLDVPGFEGIRIHAGNTKDDTEGCLLVGLAPTPTGVAQSQAAMRVLTREIENAQIMGKKVMIEVG